MSRVRVGHENEFIAHITNTDNIPEKYHFNFNHKWVAKNSDIKRIAVRAIKVYPMNLSAEVGFAIDDVNGTQQHRQFHCILIDNQSITYILIYIVSKINKFIDPLFPILFPSTVSYFYDEYSNGKSSVTFRISILTQTNSLIIFAGDAVKLFNIRQDYPQLIFLADHQAVSIVFDNPCPYSFEGWDSIQRFLHAHFSDEKYNSVSENNEPYHKLAKEYRLLYDSFESFDVWFSTNGPRITTPEIDFFALELTFNDD
jgi:hypothetical protein